MNYSTSTTGRRTKKRKSTAGSSSTSIKPKRLKLSWSDYRAHPAIAQSDVKSAVENPMLYAKQRILKVTPPSPPTAQQEWGTRCEEAIRERGCPKSVLRVPDSVLNKDGHRKGETWKIYSEARPGRILLTGNEYDSLYGPLGCYAQVIENIENHKAAQALVYGDTLRDWSVKILWPCPRTNIERKCEIDIVLWDAKIIVDVKTASDPTPWNFRWAIKKWGYDIQCSTYLEAIKALTGETFRFAFVVVRNSPPYDVYVYEDTPEFLAWADLRAAEYLDKFLAFQASGKWLPDGWGETVKLEPIT